jgi:branched-chain amino acid transport system substrate-binding protein
MIGFHMQFHKTLVFLTMLCAAMISRAEPGVTSSTITLGQSAALTGPAKELGREMRDGALAYFDYINSQGGVNGRKIVLKTLDDGYEADRAAVNTKKLVDQEGVFALFGYVGTPTSNASLLTVNEAQIPFFAPLSGAQSLREPFNRNVFHIRASYFEETEKIIQHITTLSINRIAVFYQNDGYGRAGLEGVARAMKKRNIEIVGTGTVERNSSDVAAAVAKIKESKPQAIIMVAAYNSSATFIKAMLAQGVQPIFWNISFVGSQALARELGKDARGVQISQVVPAPWDDINPIVKEYRKIYQQGGKREFDYVSMESFIAAKVFVEGLKRAGSSPTREGLVKALESMSSYDVGGLMVRYGPNQHNGSSFVDLTIISRDGRFLR